jgi:hypothetical protein
VTLHSLPALIKAPKGIRETLLSMSLPRRFLNYDNFELAFKRIVRGGNKEYKKFYRHLFPSYNFALKQNLEDLIKEIKKGIYKPATPYSCLPTEKKWRSSAIDTAFPL